MRRTLTLILTVVLAVALGASPASALDDSCWGQATAAFAKTGEMGQHASQQETPRLGLANLADALYDGGIITEPTVQALGAWVTDELGLVVEACE